MSEIQLFDIHNSPEDASLKLEYADWEFGHWSDPRGELIRAQEAFRKNRHDSSASAESLIIASRILRTDANPSALEGRLCELLEERYLRAYSTDCANRVLSLVEAEIAEDIRPGLALKASRDYLHRRVRIEELHNAGAEAMEAVQWLNDPACTAGHAIGSAAFYGCPAIGFGPASYAAALAVELAMNRKEAGDAETRWQIGRLIDLWLYGWDYPLPSTERDALGTGS